MNTYDNPYFHDNVYGHVISLLTGHGDSREGLHLDIGCSLGPIAEHVRDDLGRKYIGLDIDTQALAQLGARGFQTHALDLSDIERAEATLRQVIGDQAVASMSIIDTLEHVAEPEKVVAMLRRISEAHCAPLAVSVPNVAHRDVGFKLAFGRWDYTKTGLLDHTHLRGFTQASLQTMMQTSGWHLVESKDVKLSQSDQYFPSYHPALATGALLQRVMSHVRDGVDATATTNQFVGLYLPGHGRDAVIYTDDHGDAERPFLSVITRTQGKRLDTLRDVFLCLSAQTDQDFEVLIIGHKLPPESVTAVERVIEDTNATIRNRIRLVKVDDGTRTRPLNVGFSEAKGQYIAILDDDDIVMGHWVEEFRKLANRTPGRVLRSRTVAQSWQPVRTNYGSPSVRAVGGMDSRYPKEFDFLQHLVENNTPPVSIAFPHSAFHDLGITFDESLTTTEDWDFMMRTANVCDVGSGGEITSIYRLWKQAESSYTLHSAEEWQSNHHAIWRKFDAMPLLLAPGSATRIRQLVQDWNRVHRGQHGPLPDPLLEEQRYADALREQIHATMNSRTWALGWPVRAVATLMGRKQVSPMLWAMGPAELENYQARLQASKSWRFANKLKRLFGQ
ncbi:MULTISPECIES: glycosyltransferase [Lysobacter]|uniref:glycosyltransferase n=1 Tax=Lysobacter TaxID=68 RepID=UPI00068CC04E|nr:MULTISPECIES: glycosyltransferase [Lysobacter]